jgi:predicted nucleic acid-binding protein
MSCTIVNMDVVTDTSVIIAVITGAEEKARLVELTRGRGIIAPASVHWEVGNAFSSLLKRRQVTHTDVVKALEAYEQIPIRFLDVDLGVALQIASDLSIYAYDAYLIACARENGAPLLALDRGLIKAARHLGVQVLEVT